MSPLPPFHFRPLALSALLSLVASLAACGQPSDTGQFCTVDSDCDEVCNRLQECQAASDLVSIRVHWTIGGVAPSPAGPEACGAIANFEVALVSDNLRDPPVAYYPVPCELGQVFYDRMPRRLNSLRLTAVDSSEQTLESEQRPLEGSDIDVVIDFPATL